MSINRKAPTEPGESFHTRLQRLRIKIDSLPAAQRIHLIELADTIARQHRQLEHRVSHNHGVD